MSEPGDGECLRVAGGDHFPFETGEEVTVRIEEDKNRVVVEKVE